MSSEREPPIVAGAVVEMAPGPAYAVRIRTGHHDLVGDEPHDNGGADAGPSPFGLLLASLGSCTAITLRMYAERKSWKLTNVEVRLFYRWNGDQPVIERTLTLTGELDETQCTRIAEIAEKTPVTRALRAGVDIRTTLR
jgi:putative redox protein